MKSFVISTSLILVSLSSVVPAFAASFDKILR